MQAYSYAMYVRVPGQTSAVTLAQRHFSARSLQGRAIATQDTAAQNPHYIALQVKKKYFSRFIFRLSENIICQKEEIGS